MMEHQSMIPISKGEIQGFSPRQTPTLKIDSSGQSTIEFLTTFAFAIFILFLYVKAALNITNGYFIHFATYQASRVFLTFDNGADTPESTDNLAKARAEETFRSILGDSDVEIEFNMPGEVGNSVFVGAIGSFQERFGIGNFVGGSKMINFVSESFLGREPPVGECARRVCNAISKIIGQCNSNVTLFDNGC